MDLIYKISIVLFLISFFFMILKFFMLVIRFFRKKKSPKPNNNIKKKLEQESLEWSIDALNSTDFNLNLKNLWLNNLDLIKDTQFSKALMLIKLKNSFQIQYYYEYQINELLYLENKINLINDPNYQDYYNYLFNGKKIYISGELSKSFLANFFDAKDLKTFNEFFIFPFSINQDEMKTYIGFFIFFKKGSYESKTKEFSKEFINRLNTSFPHP